MATCCLRRQQQSDFRQQTCLLPSHFDQAAVKVLRVHLHETGSVCNWYEIGTDIAERSFAFISDLGDLLQIGSPIPYQMGSLFWKTHARVDQHSAVADVRYQDIETTAHLLYL